MSDLKSNLLKPKYLEKESNFRYAIAQLNKCIYGLPDKYPKIINKDIDFLKHTVGDHDPRSYIK